LGGGGLVVAVERRRRQAQPRPGRQSLVMLPRRQHGPSRLGLLPEGLDRVGDAGGHGVGGGLPQSDRAQQGHQMLVCRRLGA
jgi:hypothetical protein